ncbi:MAG TPA: xanthine dehydrogenase family protein molybdopterin-binding subunit [Patescibacteria group bacterium]|nr:xanthine dehydrogenase family protein molybdopterin-binding subunit [Patescibacteria group bacterium]
MIPLVKVSRRDFLRVVPAAGAGLVIGLRLDGRRAAAAERTAAGADAGATGAVTSGAAAPFSPNAWIQIAPDGVVTLWVAKSEMGQGVRTSLPMILAEEIGADFSHVKIEQAPLDPRFGDQSTGGSSSVKDSWGPLRQAGAAARAMLIAAAAARLKVPEGTLSTRGGEVVQSKGGKSLPFSALVGDAAALPLPKNPPLKDPRDFTLVGKTPPRTDTPLKIAGAATYGIDVRVPGMLFAAVARSPVFGGTLARVDDRKVKQMPGVRGVVTIGRGVAVVADTTWAAFRGRDALEVSWNEGAGASESSAGLRERCDALSRTPGKAVRSDGDVEAALAKAAKRVEAVYEAPFQAHAPMEPVNATAHVEKDRCTIWAPTQDPGDPLKQIMTITGLPKEAIRINVTFLGGGFGRRLNNDYIVDAVEISKAIGKPVQMIYSREEDLRHDFYRPFSLHRLTGGLDKEGRVVAWRHRLVTTSIAAWDNPSIANPERDEIGGAFDVPFAIPNVQVEYHAADSRVPRGYWRSVEASFNAFAVQSFIDELAAAAGRDPLRVRLDLLKEDRRIPYPDPTLVQDTARLRAVLESAAKQGSWGAPLPARRGRGLAAHFSFATYCAQTAEVEVSPEGAVRVARVSCAVDCGRVVHPGLVEAQLQSAIVFGLTAALKGGITIEKGRVRESNFNDYEVLRIDEMPVVDVRIVPSDAPPTGIGEPGVPPIAPAVMNAVFAATGKRVRRLPLDAGDLKVS